MIANINPETGIRYGVVALNTLAEWAFDEFFYNGENLTYKAIEEEWRAENPDEDELPDELFECADECEYSLETDGMKLGISYLGGAPLVWVFESPHTTQARECSPCVPNAGNLDCLDSGGFDCYTLPKEWFGNN